MGRGRGYSYDVHVPYQYLVIGRQKEVFFKKTSRWIYLGLDLPLKLGTGIFLDLNQNEMLDTGTDPNENGSGLPHWYQYFI